MRIEGPGLRAVTAAAHGMVTVEHWATVPVYDPHKVLAVKRELPVFPGVPGITGVVPAL